MIASLMIATIANPPRHDRCHIETRDTITVRRGQVASFEIADTCELHTLTIVADNDSAGVTLAGVNRHSGHDLTVRIRIPLHLRRGLVLYPFAFTASDPYGPPIADLHTVRVT